MTDMPKTVEYIRLARRFANIFDTIALKSDVDDILSWNIKTEIIWITELKTLRFFVRSVML
jgi:hypothetical protein